jgi:hypothetical protein
MKSASETKRENSDGSRPKIDWVRWAAWIFLIFMIAGVLLLLDASSGGFHPIPEAEAPMLTSRTLELAMYQYAQDHDGGYPTGRSSTEVFQKLVDGDYIYDPKILYLKMPGKTPATSKHLLPENVAWDVTVPMDGTTSDDVPGVFCTGFRLEYKPGGNAIPLADRSRPDTCKDSFFVCFHSNNARYKTADKDAGGVVKKVIPVDAKLGDAAFSQLTPYGPLITK